MPTSLMPVQGTFTILTVLASTYLSIFIQNQFTPTQTILTTV